MHQEETVMIGVQSLIQSYVPRKCRSCESVRNCTDLTERHSAVVQSLSWLKASDFELKQDIELVGKRLTELFNVHKLCGDA